MNTEIRMEVFMKDNRQRDRIRAVKRFQNGEKPDTICISLGSGTWL